MILCICLCFSLCTGEKSCIQAAGSTTSSGDNSALMKCKSLSLELEGVPTDAGPPPVRPKRTGRSGASAITSDVHVMVVWLESYEDHLGFPLCKLVINCYLVLVLC